MSDTMDSPMTKGARRLEIFTGAGHRRRWNADEKLAILAECERSGDTVSAVARRHGLTASQVFSWRRAARAAANAVERVSGNPIGFAPVVVERSALAAGDWLLEIAMGSAVVRVRRELNPRVLSAVLRALKD
jgi:transposase